MRGVTQGVLCYLQICGFLLTRLMRGVTGNRRRQSKSVQISTHTPHARRDSYSPASISRGNISTHTPHARRDDIEKFINSADDKFLLTRLMRGVTINL